MIITRQALREMLTQIHYKIQNQILREGLTEKRNFDVAKVVSPASITKWAKAENDEKTQIKLFKAAQKGDKSALEYIFWKMKGAIQKVFWTKFLGPNPKMQQYRIQHENAWETWLGIAWMTLTGGFQDVKMDGRESRLKGAVESFDVDKIKTGNPMSLFAWRYKQMLINSSGNANFGDVTGGITETGGWESGDWAKNKKTIQYEPTWYDSDANNEYNPDNDDLSSSAGGPGYNDETFNKVNTKIEVEEFLNKWKQFAQDPQLQMGTKGVTGASLLFEAISNPNASYPDMAKKFRIARNSVATNLQKAVEILETYNITGHDLMQAIKSLGNDRVGSYLSADVPETKSDLGDNFKSTFQEAMTNPKMWEPNVRSADAGNVIYWWINDNFPTLTALAKDYEFKEKDITWFFNRAMKIFGKYGIDEGMIKSAVKKYGTKAVTDLIGDDA